MRAKAFTIRWPQFTVPYDNTSALINLLQMVYHNVKHYFQMQIDMQDVNQVLASHFNEFWTESS